MTAPSRPRCHAPASSLQICLPAWFRFQESSGENAASDPARPGALVDVDVEASGLVHCEVCDWTGPEDALSDDDHETEVIGADPGRAGGG